MLCMSLALLLSPTRTESNVFYAKLSDERHGCAAPKRLHTSSSCRRIRQEGNNTRSDSVRLCLGRSVCFTFVRFPPALGPDRLRRSSLVSWPRPPPSRDPHASQSSTWTSFVYDFRLQRMTAV